MLCLSPKCVCVCEQGGGGGCALVWTVACRSVLACLSASIRALEVNIAVGTGCGLACHNLSALQRNWALRHGNPLITPRKAPREYLIGIFTSSLVGTMMRQQSWSSQILSALAWAQVGMLSDYCRMVVMQALHKAVRSVCAMSPWYTEHALRAAYAVGHHLPCAWEHACQKLFHWLKANAVWEGDLYTNAAIWGEFQPEGCTPVWCHNVGLLHCLEPCMLNPDLCVCSWVGAPNTVRTAWHLVDTTRAPP